ncbi:VanW family protein [Paeniglutamicibacter cryotolerans]|uniref:Vancomycin resistance protein YoaR n=1 Tax=Paeniglutamicibacter cryotolerans TaxID=670079 RepID=A0A839QNX6_9MICC|nr:VanW family protein [Paeniglutamicibacter cryotolerans]MBB2997303.1 vancomycin resistance protein YoaR [Paeniglutamicibacter cryotolerans]
MNGSLESKRDRGDRHKDRGTSRGWLIAGASVVLACGIYGAGAWYLGSQIPGGTTVHGVNVGGLGKDAAKLVLEQKLTPLASKPITVQAGSKTAELDPRAAGLSLDLDASLEGLTGFNLNPFIMYERATGQFSPEPVFDVDRAKLQEALKAKAPKLLTKVKEGALSFDGTTAKLSKPVIGVAVNVDESVDTVAKGWFDAAETISLPTTTEDPAVSADAFNAALKDQAEPLVAGPVKVTDGTATASLSPSQLASAASFKIDGPKIQLVLDPERVDAALLEANPDFKSSAKDAKFVLTGGKPAITPSETGKAVDTQGLAEKIVAASNTQERTVKVALTTVEPELTTEKAKALGVKDAIVTFSTPYPASDTVRTKNLLAGTSRLNGLVVMPGETFSLEKAFGPITTANGYFGSGVVVNGFATEAVGGGLSQVSTQMFNVGHLAGYDDITHKPHSRWFDRYPAGREATLWEGQVDMKWKNNTPYAVMIEAWVGGGKVNTRLWSTKYWDVKTSTGAKYNFTKPRTEYNPASKCVPESGGKQGFSIKVTRNRSSADKTLPTETLSWTYQPWNKVVCGKKP